jgi:hypothetical protein
MRRPLLLFLLASALVGTALLDPATASEHLGTHREQRARHYCWKRLGLEPDATPTRHQAERLKPCIKKRLGYDDRYMDQF